MAHLRSRHARDTLARLLGFSPIIGVFGHRQAGKTTFLEAECASYVSLDDRCALELAQGEPERFLRKLGKAPAGIDECQLAPELFPALKERVRRSRAPGQIVLSGSVRFTSRVAIRESLTGRIVGIDMLPLALTELSRLERARLPLALLAKGGFDSGMESDLGARTLRERTRQIDLYGRFGGLPGLCFVRDDRLRNERAREQLELILDRVLRLVYPTSLPYSQISDYVASLARQEGDPVHPTRLRREAGISELTQKKLLRSLEGVFVIRQISLEGDRKGVCAYFEDQFEHAFLCRGETDPLRRFEGLVYRNVRASFNYELGLDFRCFQFRLRPDVRVPLVIQANGGCLGMIPSLEGKPSSRDLRMARRFLQRYSPAVALIVTKGNPATRVLERRILQIPAERLLFE